MNLRPLVDTDIPDCRAFWATVAGLGLSSVDEPDALIAYFHRNPGLSWGAFDGGVVGTVLAGHDGRRGLIYHLAVAHTHRGLGVSSELMRRALDGLASCGIGNAHVFVLAEHQGLAFWAASARQGWNRRGDLLVLSRGAPSSVSP